MIKLILNFLFCPELSFPGIEITAAHVQVEGILPVKSNVLCIVSFAQNCAKST